MLSILKNLTGFYTKNTSANTSTLHHYASYATTFYEFYHHL